MAFDGGSYDVIVVGAGHAGVESALAAGSYGVQNTNDYDQSGHGGFYAL